MKAVRREIASASFWTLGGFTSLMLVGVLCNAILARSLSPQALGVYFLAWNLVATTSVLGRLGLDHAVLRLVAGGARGSGVARPRPAPLTLLRLSVTGAVVAGAVLAWVVVPLVARTLFDSPRLATLSLLVGGWCCVEAARLVASEALRGAGDVRGATVLGDAGRQVLFAAFLAALVVAGDGRLTLESVLVSAIASGGAVGLLALWPLKGRLRVAATAPAMRSGEVLGMSLPMMVTALSLLLVSQGDVWLAGAFLPEEVVAVYVAAARLAIFVVIPLRIANVVLSPLIVRMHAAGQLQRLERLLRLSAAAAALPTLLVVAVLLLAGADVLGLVYGEYYQQGDEVLIAVACGHLVNAMTGGCGQVLLMTGHQKVMMAITAVSGAVFLVLGAVATWQLGALGLALASAGVTASSNAMLVLVVRRRIGIWTVPVLTPRAVRRALQP